MELARLRPGPGFSVGRFVGYYSLRFVPSIFLRRLIARALAGWVNVRSRRNRPLGAHVGTGAQVEDLLAELRERGVVLGDALDEARLAAIRTYLRTQPMVSPDGRHFTEDCVPADVQIATYPLATVLNCPHVVELMNAAPSLALARAYLGCAPTISSIRMDWSFAGGAGPNDVQRFHRDHDDWAFLKYFLYLTDVDDSTGPHEFALGSHRTSGRMSAGPYADEEVAARFGKNNLIRIVGRRGTCFYEDTWGVHKGAVPRSGARLMFQVQYSVLPVFKYQYCPVRVSGTGARQLRQSATRRHPESTHPPWAEVRASHEGSCGTRRMPLQCILSVTAEWTEGSDFAAIFLLGIGSASKRACICSSLRVTREYGETK